LKDAFEMFLLKKHLPLEFIDNKQYWSVAMLVIHIYLTVLSLESSLMKPFQNLIQNPQNFEQQFLPAMPHDDDFEVFQVASKDPVKFYKCPNGHYYSIGDCTKPASVGLCPTCKSPIGGQGYILSDGNSEAGILNDSTKRGFCLPDRRGTQSERIRKMSPLQTSFLRLFISSSIYMSLTLGKKAEKLATSDDINNNPKMFFANQILKELEILSVCLQHSVDESSLLVHFLLNQMQNLPKNNHDSCWKTKEGCKKYEEEFCSKVFKDIAGDQVEEILKNMTVLLKNDSENSNADQLFKIAYEIVTPQVSKNFSLNNVEEEKCWLYRVHITLDHMKNGFYASYQNDVNFTLLNKFLNQMRQLEVIGNLQNIASMVYLLFNTFNRQIDRQQANSLTLTELLKRDDIFQSENHKNIIRLGAIDFIDAWKKLYLSLENFYCGQILEKLDVKNSKIELINNYKDLTLSHLLPSLTKNGRYIYALILFLTNINNEFLQFYSKMKNSEYKIFETELNNLNKSNLISFKCEKDILRITYLNCVYSLGIETKLNTEYKFQKIQTSIEEKILYKKCLINNKVRMRNLLIF
jgi:hypothetical protein